MDENSAEHIGQRHASGTKERRGRKLTDSWPDAVAMAATSITAWKTFMMLQMIKGRSLVLVNKVARKFMRFCIVAGGSDAFCQRIAHGS